MELSMRVQIAVLSIAFLIGSTARGMAQEPVTMRPRDRTPLATRTPEECVGVVAPADPKNFPTEWHREEYLMVLPPVDYPRSLRGRTIAVRQRTTARGILDSIEVSGIDDEPKYRARYISQIQRMFAKGDFRPAVFQGCAVDSWYSFTMTLGPK